MDKQQGLREDLTDEDTDRCLEHLRHIQKQISEKHTGRTEIPDPGLHLGLGSERTVEGKLERLTRACIWHAVSLKTEFKLRLLYTIDGYLSAVDAKNPVSTFLLARHLLELAATVSAIDFQLDASTDIDFRDWNRRGIAFLAPLYIARHSTSDPRFNSILLKSGIPLSLSKPVRISAPEKERLEVLTDAGSAAAHRGWEPDPQQLEILASIMEHFVRSFILKEDAGKLKQSIPPRHERRARDDREQSSQLIEFPSPKPSKNPPR
jgi:hypothetical protein